MRPDLWSGGGSVEGHGEEVEAEMRWDNNGDEDVRWVRGGSSGSRSSGQHKSKKKDNNNGDERVRWVCSEGSSSSSSGCGDVGASDDGSGKDSRWVNADDGGGGSEGEVGGRGDGSGVRSDARKGRREWRGRGKRGWPVRGGKELDGGERVVEQLQEAFRSVRCVEKEQVRSPLTAMGRFVKDYERVPWGSDLLDGTIPGDLPSGAALFHQYSKGYTNAVAVTEEIELAAAEAKTEGRDTIHFIVWVKHHWVATSLTIGKCWKVYDSARSRAVELELRRWASALGLPIPVFPSIPQQRYGSEECGVFAFLMMHKLRAGQAIPALRTVPQRLAPPRPTLEPVMGKMRCPQRAAAAGWSILESYYKACEEVVWVDGGGTVYEPGTHLLVSWHWQGREEHVVTERALVTARQGTTRAMHHVLVFGESSLLRGQLLNLPVPHGSNVVIVAHQVDTNPTPESDTSSDVEEDEQDEEEHHRFYETFRAERSVRTFGGPDEKAMTGFRPLTVGEFRRVQVTDIETARANCPPLVWTAMITETRKGHIRELRGLMSFVRDLPDNTPLDHAIAEYAMEAKKSRSLQWSSVSRILQTLIGAFAALPNYLCGDRSTFPPVVITHWPGVRDSLKTSKRLANVHGVREPVPATTVQVAEACRMLDEHDKLFLQMCWLTSQRPGDVVHLRCSHIKLKADDGVVIRFAEGKNHAATDQYSIHCVVPSGWVRGWRSALTDRRQYVFSVPTRSARAGLMRRVREALRGSVNGKNLELKSLRRGSLQTMAECGASVDELLKFSRHQDPKTLRRYLAYDGVADAENQGAREFTRVLGGGTDGGEDRVVKPEKWCAIALDGEIHFGFLPKPALDVDRSDYPYHVSDVAAVSLEAISTMASTGSKQVAEDWESMLGFLNGTEMFSAAEAGPAPRSRVRRGLIDRLLEVRQIRHIRKGDAKNFCRVFVIPEDGKSRWRVIKHPKAINTDLAEHMGAVTVHHTNAKRRSARLDVMRERGCIEFDFKGYFDQFPLSEEVSKFFAFSDGRRVYAPLRMPMGASFSVSVATAATRVMVDGIGQGLAVSVAHQIDNVRISGERRDCVEAAKRFVARCRTVGITIGDLPADAEVTEAMYQVTNDFMGDVVNYRTKSIRCRERHVKRLSAWVYRVGRPAATYRDWFACMGTAVYMAEAVGLAPCDYYTVRTFFRSLAREVAYSPERWDQRMPHEPPRDAWFKFLRVLMANKEAVLVAHPRRAVHLFVDASKWGYGALLLGAEGERHHVQHPWSVWELGECALELSTVAEPKALVAAVGWAARLYPQYTVMCYTDHQPFVDAFWKGGSFSPGYNSAIQELGLLRVPVILRHVGGKAMPADGISRDVDRRPEPRKRDWELAAEWVGEFYGDCASRYYRVIGGGPGARTFRTSDPHTEETR